MCKGGVCSIKTNCSFGSDTRKSEEDMSTVNTVYEEPNCELFEDCADDSFNIWMAEDASIDFGFGCSFDEIDHGFLVEIKKGSELFQAMEKFFNQ